MSNPRIYLDNAATSWPKPESVYTVMDRFYRDSGGSSGRGGHRAALDAQAIVDNTRRALAKLIGAPNAESIAMMFNGTDALNAAFQGVLRQGDHVVTTVCEHNSVLRPLRHAEDELGCEVTLVDCDDFGVLSADAVLAAVRPNTRLVAVTHASNVTGAVQPVEAISIALADSPTLVLVDAAQSVGHLPIDVGRSPVDLLAAPGHKALLGPTGTGLLYVKPGVETQLRPWRRGGTGSQSENQRQPQAMPHWLESGNHNIVGLAGLLAGIEYLSQHGISKLRDQVSSLASQLRRELAAVPGCRVFGPPQEGASVPVVSASFHGYDPHEAAAVLEMTAGVECRAGLHCAPAMHDRLGTTTAGGTVRLSLGVFTTRDEIDKATQAAQALAS